MLIERVGGQEKKEEEMQIKTKWLLAEGILSFRVESYWRQTGDIN